MQQQPEDTATRALSDQDFDFTIFESWSARKLVNWAIHSFFPRVALTCSLSVDDTVLAHMIQEINPSVPIIFIDTGFHFDETLELRDRLTELWGWNLVEYRPRLSIEEQDRLFGPELYTRQPDQCCALRKVEPMRRALAGLTAWISGLRRSQAANRAAIGKVERHLLENDRAVLKVNPLADWHSAQLWEYVRSEGIPYNPLYAQHYRSIGCKPCTKPVRPGEPQRLGRWPKMTKTECGLHTFTRRCR
jgi:phosphoadenosine phosphosulfate reductase